MDDVINPVTAVAIWCDPGKQKIYLCVNINNLPLMTRWWWQNSAKLSLFLLTIPIACFPWLSPILCCLHPLWHSSLPWWLAWCLGVFPLLFAAVQNSSFALFCASLVGECSSITVRFRCRKLNLTLIILSLTRLHLSSAVLASFFRDLRRNSL